MLNWRGLRSLGLASFGLICSVCAIALAETDDRLEVVRWRKHADGIRLCLLLPHDYGVRPRSQRSLILYATPNGNTIEQTLGCTKEAAPDWRYDIQHVAAQVRQVRTLDQRHAWGLVIVQSPQLSWPTYRSRQGNPGLIRELVEALQKEFDATRLVLAAHSGGGSFLFGYVEGYEQLPADLKNILFLDANYAYSDALAHGDKLLRWLESDQEHRLTVIAYDDREIELQGKKVVGPQGGTFRASQRMLDRFRRDLKLTETNEGAFLCTTGKEGRLSFCVHPNRENKILHTALVGDMNGLVYGMTLGMEGTQNWGKFGGPRSYSKWIPPRPFVEKDVEESGFAKKIPNESSAAIISREAPEVFLKLPPRPRDACGGSEFAKRIDMLLGESREAEIRREVLSGNIPEFLRRLTPIRVSKMDEQKETITATYFVTADYVSVGDALDTFRVPMTPRTAVAIAESMGGTLITAKISDDIHAAATLKLTPQPLTKDREASVTFFAHHQGIERLIHGSADRALVAGVKKDLVWTKRLLEKPRREAIYGWHYPEGRPIQPLYVGHVEHYVDYSHGLRVLADRMMINDRWVSVLDVLRDSQLCQVLSGEGVVDVAELKRATGW